VVTGVAMYWLSVKHLTNLLVSIDFPSSLQNISQSYLYCSHDSARTTSSFFVQSYKRDLWTTRYITIQANAPMFTDKGACLLTASEGHQLYQLNLRDDKIFSKVTLNTHKIILSNT